MNENTEIRTNEKSDIKSKLQELTNINFLKTLIKPGIALLISLLLLIMAFCPIIKYEQVNVYKDYELFGDDDPDIETFKTSIGISATKYIGLFFDTLKSDTYKELKKSDLYDKMEDLEDDILDAMEDMDEDENSSKEIEKLQLKYYYNLYRLALQSEDVSVSLIDILTFIFAIAYVLIAIALFAFALLNLLKKILGELLPVGFAENKKLTSALLCLLPGVILALYVLLFFGKSINSIALYSGTLMLVSIAGCAVFSLILGFACIVALIVVRVKAGELVIDKVARRRIISVALAVVIILSIGSAMFNFKLYGDYTYSGKNETAGIKLDMYVLSMNLEDFSSFYKDVAGKIGNIGGGSAWGSNLTGEELETGATLALLTQYHEDEILSFNIVCITLFVIIALVCAAVVVIDSYNLTTGSCVNNRLVSLRVIAHLAALFMTFCLVVFAFAFDEDLSDEAAKISFTASSIIIYFASIFMIAYRPRRVKKAKNSAEQIEQK